MKRIFEMRPEFIEGATEGIDTPMGRAYITVNFIESKPVEVFISLGKTGSNERACAEAIARVCSTALQHGLPVEALTKQLRGISSTDTLGIGPAKILSMPDAVGRVLQGLTANPPRPLKERTART